MVQPTTGPGGRRRTWGLVLLVLLACYLLAYLVLSRVTAIESVVKTDDGKHRKIYRFTGPKIVRHRIKLTGEVWYLPVPSDSDRLAYWVFFPLVLLDAQADARHHHFLVHAGDRGYYSFWGQGTFRGKLSSDAARPEAAARPALPAEP